MVDISIFDIVDIPFDNPVKTKMDVAKIKKEIQRATAEKKTSLSYALSPANVSKINKQIKILQDAQRELFEDDRFSEQYYSLCAQKVELAKKSYIDTIMILSENGNRPVTLRMLKDYSRSEGLSFEKTIRPLLAFGEALAQVKLDDVDIDKDFPKFPSNAERTYELLKSFRSLKGEELKGNPPTADVMDLYDLAAYFENNIASAKSYRSRPTKELFELFDKKAKAYQLAQIDSFVAHCRNLSSDAKTYSFKDDSARKAYDTFLLYKTKELQDVIEQIHRIFKPSLKQGYVAKQFIRQILKFFPDFYVACAIYNKEADLFDDPIHPEDLLK